MGMPARGAALAEVHDATVVVRGIPGLDDRLTRPGNRSGPSFDPLGAFHWDIRYVFERDHLHDDCLLVLTGSKYPKSASTQNCQLPIVSYTMQRAAGYGVIATNERVSAADLLQKSGRRRT
jgi:hypothetical protein